MRSARAWSSNGTKRSRRTLQERGFDFDFATRIFRGRAFEREDTRLNYGERRVIAVGKVEDVFVTLVYTDCQGARRVIAAWPSSRKERKLWQPGE
ncbi:MAG TPA: BrnT family toxin [Beijerinckiaceae bacterium]|nr:BrnT family toxin [Beijerinckiaceae bacterium]